MSKTSSTNCGWEVKYCAECGKEINPHTDDVQNVNGMTFCSTKCVEKWYGYWKKNLSNTCIIQKNVVTLQCQ